MIPPILYLASNSPRRRQLLALAGWEFKLFPVEIDEDPQPAENPAAYVLRLAEEKAQLAAARVPEVGIVLAADTTVADPDGPGGHPLILGKPSNQAEAVEMLQRLRGKVHQVYTAVAALDSRSGPTLKDVCVSNVPMRDYSDAEIQAYVESGDPLDKAGAYAIQHAGFHPVEDFTGCYASVMGLSLCHTAHLLEQLGVYTGEGIATACLRDAGLHCPVQYNLQETLES